MSKPTIFKPTYVFKNSTPAPEKLRKQTDDSLKKIREKDKHAVKKKSTHRDV